MLLYSLIGLLGSERGLGLQDQILVTYSFAKLNEIMHQGNLHIDHDLQ